MVVERGLARCPRCVSVADYAFIEDGRGMRYEVRCRKCGERYEEDSRPSAAVAPVSVPEPPIEWPRDHDPVPPRDWRAELRGHVPTELIERVAGEIRERSTAAVRHGRAGAEGVGRRVGTLSEHARAWLRDRREQSEQRREEKQPAEADQTGG